MFIVFVRKTGVSDTKIDDTIFHSFYVFFDNSQKISLLRDEIHTMKITK